MTESVLFGSLYYYGRLQITELCNDQSINNCIDDFGFYLGKT